MKRVEHVGIAVRDLAQASEFYEKVLGLPCVGKADVAAQKVRLAFFAEGETRIELLEPTAPDAPVARFLESRGPGLHHICLRVDDLDAEMDRLIKAGISFVADSPRPGAHGGRVAFIEPKSAGGVLIELAENVS